MDKLSEQQWLTEVLSQDIPLGGAMALCVTRLDDEGIVLDFPLEPNVNDKGTAFGGAMSSAMILAGWALPRLILRRRGLNAKLVIGRAELRFVTPVTGAFQARCRWPEVGDRDNFLKGLQTHGKGRLDMSPEILADGKVAATLSARYAAIDS